jgi:hypothetical protein
LAENGNAFFANKNAQDPAAKSVTPTQVMTHVGFIMQFAFVEVQPLAVTARS